MIKSLILTALLTSGVGANATPLLNNKAETEQTQIAETSKNENTIKLYAESSTSQQAESEIEWVATLPTYATAQRVSWTHEHGAGENKDYMYVNAKYESQQTTNQASIHSYLYENNKFSKNVSTSATWQNTGWLFDIWNNASQLTQDKTNNTFLFATSFAPYQNITANNITIQFASDIEAILYMYYNTNLPADEYNFYLKETYNIISSTQDWSRALDKSLTQSATFNYDLYQDLTTVTHNFGYNRQIDEQLIAIDLDVSGIDGPYWQNEQWHIGSVRQNYTRTYNVPIDNKETNYIIVYKTIELYVETIEGVNATDYFNLQNNNSAFFAGFADYYDREASTPSNLNTENVRNRWHSIHGTKATFTGTYMPPLQTEVVDIPNLMFTVLGMPFTFISTAFNLTLFPGTPYQFNISSVFLMILGILIFVFVLRMILKVFK